MKALSETNWTSSCIITMKHFESLFKEHDEAFAVLSYLSRHGKALYLSIKSKEPIMVCSWIFSLVHLKFLQHIWQVYCLCGTTFILGFHEIKKEPWSSLMGFCCSIRILLINLENSSLLNTSLYYALLPSFFPSPSLISFFLHISYL